MKRKMIILLMAAFGILSLIIIKSCRDDTATPKCPDTYIWDYEKGDCVKVGQTGVY